MKKIYLTLLTLGAVMFSSESVQSQSQSGESIKVKVFDDSQSYFEPGKREPIVKDLNYIRFNPYLLLRGAFTLGYERVLSYKHAVAVDAGFTYRDYLYEGLTVMDDEGSAETGYYADFSYKFYPKGYNNFEGPYLSPGLITRKYNVTNEVYLNNDYQDIDASYGMTEMYLKFGYVYESWYLDDVVIDFYTGLGLRNISANKYTIESYSNNTEYVKEYTESKQVPAVYLGFKVGIPF
jgi:hypothetical protein